MTGAHAPIEATVIAVIVIGAESVAAAVIAAEIGVVEEETAATVPSVATPNEPRVLSVRLRRLPQAASRPNSTPRLPSS